MLSASGRFIPARRKLFQKIDRRKFPPCSLISVEKEDLRAKEEPRKDRPQGNDLAKTETFVLCLPNNPLYFKLKFFLSSVFPHFFFCFYLHLHPVGYL